MAAIGSGAHLLVEKPVGATAAEAHSLARAAVESPAVTAASLVLREAPFFRAVHEVVTSGVLGRLVSVHHGEHVVSWHMAHSFVRGAWSRSASATPFIVQKCCHDLDLIAWNLGGDSVKVVSSFGSASWFSPVNAPDGATGRCTDGCPVAGCPYDARAIYLDERRTGWPVHVISDEFDPASRLAALTSGPYGVCAFKTGSDVVDRQVVSMETGDGVTVTLEADGHARFEHRTVAYRGTKGTLIGRFGAGQELTLVDASSGVGRPVPIPAITGGHGGGDEGVLNAFVKAIRGIGPLPAGPAEVLEGHLLAFAAEHSRVTGAVVGMESVRSLELAGTGVARWSSPGRGREIMEL
ncbi:Gfo/Idh/MocA family oxidoreductase [bacterium]|nr:Gfo/Idh/MocA family oxidoreductase [bacterium]